MYTEIEDGADDWTWQVAEADVLALAEETAALGAAVADAFRSAASIFYADSAPEASLAVMALPGAVADAPILAKIVAVLRHRALAGEHFRRIGQLQQIAGAFAQMGKHCREIAGIALDMQGAADSLIAPTAPDVYELLRILSHQTYVVLRGTVVAVRGSHAPTAQHVLDAAAELDRILLDLRTAAQRAIAMYANYTLPFQHVVVVGARMRDIGAQAQVIARLIAQVSPVAQPDPAYD